MKAGRTVRRMIVDEDRGYPTDKSQIQELEQGRMHVLAYNSPTIIFGLTLESVSVTVSVNMVRRAHRSKKPRRQAL